MTSAEPVGRPGTPEPDPSRRRVPPASGIYGLIVAGSVLAAVGSDLPTGPLALAVFVTLVVYWLAEEYAGLVEHASAGHLPSWARTRAALKAKWPIVSCLLHSGGHTPSRPAAWRDALDCRSHRAGRHRGAAHRVRLEGWPGLWLAWPSAGRHDVARRRTGPAHDRSQVCRSATCTEGCAPARTKLSPCAEVRTHQRR